MPILSRLGLGLLQTFHLAILASPSSAQPRYLVAPSLDRATGAGRDSGADDQLRTGHRVESVEFGSDGGVVLAGELRKPAVLSRKGYPIVLLLGGGGPSPHGIYPRLEERLLARGIATLSYDKRGIGKSTGSFVDTMDLMQRDAGAAIRYIRSRNDIDHNRIAILGLSQGGVIGPALASDDPAIKAVVMLAAPAGRRGAMFLDEMRVKLTTSGMRSDAIEGVMAATHAYMDALTTGSSDTTIATLRTALGRAFVASGWSQAQAEGASRTLSDPAAISLYTVASNDALARVKAPILALYAGNDTVISTSRNIPEARIALRGNPDATVIEIPDVNHGFQRMEANASGKAEYKGWPVSDPRTLGLIDDWLAKRLRPAERN